jgi:hypothetical protein
MDMLQQARGQRSLLLRAGDGVAILLGYIAIDGTSAIAQR